MSTLKTIIITVGVIIAAPVTLFTGGAVLCALNGACIERLQRLEGKQNNMELPPVVPYFSYTDFNNEWGTDISLQITEEARNAAKLYSNYLKEHCSQEDFTFDDILGQYCFSALGHMKLANAKIDYESRLRIGFEETFNEILDDIKNQ